MKEGMLSERAWRDFFLSKESVQVKLDQDMELRDEEKDVLRFQSGNEIGRLQDSFHLEQRRGRVMKMSKHHLSQVRKWI